MFKNEADRIWVEEAIREIEADFNRSADTHLLRVPIAACPQIALYLKDESTHPTGSLKHRLARSLFLYGLCNGWIGPGTVIVEASSGSTAVSEAYFAQMLHLRFIAVMPRSTSAEKVAQIEFYGGQCHFVENASDMYAESVRLAAKHRGHYMDQFTFAERATDWRGNNNIAESIFSQMADERHPVPSWIVVGAGTGGTSATIGRYIRYRRMQTRLCLADPESSVFHRHLADSCVVSGSGERSLIEGIGRPRCEPSFLPELIDACYSVPDVASIGSTRALSRHIGRSCGGSTGTNLYAAARVIAGMKARNESGSVVTLLCDSGDRYRSTILDDAWLRQRGIDVSEVEDQMKRFLESGELH
ncbi:PLP-dependent cysteine synthase family protein [Tianweitania sediminis]|uniref:L-cysteine desulfhydrase Cds1 n=1 Tax=Tianweitania sediminis TaxID=1502156 RepID=A0A8J7R0R8_9HYPH|nr:PLP-dependent cysteine synthase family protein [Tianweitania sediminis]MBP0437995.1 PLP-dependent cysteine synthase family protein [Tianweitania sediminis]